MSSGAAPRADSAAFPGQPPEPGADAPGPMSSGDDGWQRRRVVFILTLFAAIPLLAAPLWVIARTAGPFPAPDPARLKALFDVPVSAFQPEPLENLLFLTAIVLAPPLTFVIYRLVTRLVNGMPPRAVGALAPALTAAALCALVFDGFLGLQNPSYAPACYDPINSAPMNLPWLRGGVLLTAGFLAWLLTGGSGHAGRATVSRVLGGAVRVYAAGLIVLAFALCVFSLDSVTNNQAFVVSFGAVFHTMVQVFLGRQILVDFPHQYGMYPQFLVPLFRLVGLSVLKYTVVMGLLQAFAFWLIYRFLRKATANPVVAALGFSGLVTFSFLLGRVATTEYYFQYHPLRFIFPAGAIFLTHRYFARPNRRLYYLVFVLSSVAVLWNFDTGVMVFCAWVLTLCYAELPVRRPGPILAHLGRGLAVFGGVFALFNLLVFLVYRRVPDYGGFFHFLQIFKLEGYYMLPMPLVGLWHLPVVVYFAALIAAIAALVRGERSVRARMYLFLALLGVGLFTYYQGRSHEDALISVSWPAFVILTLFTDELASGMPGRRRLADAAAVTFSLVIGVFSVVFLVAYRLDLAARLKADVGPIFSPSAARSRVPRNAALIASNTRAGGEVLIISFYSGIYHLASRTTSPLRLPGPVEWFLTSEIEEVADYLKSDRWEQVFVDEMYHVERSGEVAKLFSYLSENYLPMIFDGNPSLKLYARSVRKPR